MNWFAVPRPSITRLTGILQIALLAAIVSPLPADVRWNASFQEQYRSAADDTEVSFTVRTPPQVAGLDSYPLVLVLNGGLRVPPSQQFPHFQAQPSRGGIWGYRSLSAYDAMQVVAFMKKNYPIDPDRIYLVGSSAGASGAMHLASCFPDEFAAVIPLIAAGNNYPLVNFTNLPVAFHHGDRDWVSSVCNVRVQTQRLQALGCPTTLQEYPGAGHGIPGSHEPLAAWLFAQRRDRAPQKIRHECEVPSLGRSYWLQMQEFEDPHRRASVEADITGQLATIRPTNVASFRLDRERIPAVTTVSIGATQLPVREHYRLREGQWQVADPPAKKEVRPYEAGGAANLYQGEPLRIVYGTGGDHPDHLRAAALQLAAYGGPAHTAMQRHRFPVIADQELTDDQQAQCHLILIGKPEENSVTRSIWPQLPLSIDNGKLVVADRTPFPLKNQILGVLHPHPRHPDRLVYVLAPFLDETGLQTWAASVQYYLPGSEGFDRVSQPDLVVQDLQRRIARQMQFDSDWRWLTYPGDDVPIPAPFRDRSELARRALPRMLEKSGADFALWYGPADPGMWNFDFNPLLSFDPATYRLADYHTQHRVIETTLGSVTGAELREIWTRWGEKQELLAFPEIRFDQLDDHATYRLHIPMDLYIKLGQRQKNLLDPRPGPPITAEELLPLIFPAR